MHYPVPCEVAKMWLQRPELLATTSWIKLNTKACPLCKISIEKNEGCNHMTCRSCQHQFCWVCMGPWKVHGTSYYECNNSSNFHVKPGKYNNKEAKERPTQYVHSFEVRQASINALCIIHERIFDEIELLQTTKKIKWGEGQALKKSISQFINVESTLRWSYK
ncbi:hypothetical protein DASC09_000010 [Saccharomycopsis crataegensis]|uniref:RBR-type E3 ubiquitin transferase n=1 Tax=Saccharomycopsis crataegensis TaxID=43959 RepID=A0AAV5QD27_9ASCO|nr:hypothetical protein DASC09_000010 [Saccharomycopsis crataegensis]